MAGSGEGAGLARAWVSHLVAGGTVPWAEVLAHGLPVDAPRAAVRDGDRLPGAQQLETLRRLNLLGGPAAADPALAEEVLAVAPPGRGALDLPLTGLPAPSWGARPVDPAALPADELLRVATGVLADRLAATPLADRPPPTLADRLREHVVDRVPHRHPFRLAGPRLRVDPVRERLRALGRTPGGRDAAYLVLGAGMGRLVTDAWTSRVLEGVAPPWPEWLATWVERDTCPPRADLAAIATGWAGRVGAGRVHVLLDVSATGGLLGLREPVRPAPAAPAAAVELLRAVSAVLGVLVERHRRTRLLGEVLRPVLADAQGPPLVVPATHQAWLDRRGRGLLSALRAGGYRVHGPTDLLEHPLTEQAVPGVPGPDDDRVLDLALEVLARPRRDER